MLELTEDERDVVTELMNMGVGQAAAAFSQMIGEEITLSVPSVEVMSREAAAAALARLTSDRATGITQSFEGALAGVAALVFPEAKSLHIVRSVLGGAYPVQEITELAQETLLEIGNIILNACLGTIGNFLHTEVVSSLPALTSEVNRDLFATAGTRESGGGPDDSVVLFLHIRFLIRSDDVSGYLMFVMDVVGVERFRQLVSACLRAVGRE
ncbi:chemotaxis protein CheC [Azospirillum sp.]|uniref:chemotaxis protein CheC n=1 Tax=Azospirillum sp. TaxID=34012 RepID=UPI002D290A1A|nr:chemotaxis protein CheC [Azospirillum sp.]HYD66976.1 chemotaxis protein CheC [Azospirillum sp.]